MAEVEAGQASAQDQPNTDAGEQPGAGDEQQQQQAPRTYSQADLDRITAKVRKNAQRDAELRFRREQESRQQSGGDKGTPDKAADAKPAEEQAPKREDFKDYEEFIEARADFRARKAVREENAKIAEEAKTRTASEAAAARARNFRSRADKLMQEIPDFADVIADAADVFISEAMAEEMEESEFGPRILYEIVKNPQEAERIGKLSPSAQRREIFKLEQKFEAAAKKPKNKEGDDADGSEQEPGDEDRAEQPGANAEDKGGDETERNADGTFKSPKKRPAPEPIEPGSGRSASLSQAPSDKDDSETWLRKRNAQIEREGRA